MYISNGKCVSKFQFIICLQMVSLFWRKLWFTFFMRFFLLKSIRWFAFMSNLYHKQSKAGIMWSDREIEKNRESNPARDVHSLRFSARMNSGLGFDVGSCRLCSVRFLFTHLIILSLSKYAKSFKWNEYTENCYFGSCFVYRTILRSTNIIIHFLTTRFFMFSQSH